jgi:prepilin peptidase CpaA
VNESVLRIVFLFVLTASLVAAVRSDNVHRKIPNNLCLLVFTTGIVMNGSLSLGSGLFSQSGGGLGLGSALAGALGLFVVLWFAWLARFMGAGDVKLIASLGAWVGWQGAFPLFVFITICGGALAVVRMIFSPKRAASFKAISMNLQTLFFQWGVPGQALSTKLDLSRESADRMPYAWAIAAGMFTYAIYSYRLS